jgi:hypothetical protein
MHHVPHMILINTVSCMVYNLYYNRYTEVIRKVLGATLFPISKLLYSFSFIF